MSQDYEIDSFFTGAGLLDIGLERGGLKVRRCYEVDPVCCRTLSRNRGAKVEPVNVAQKLVKGEARPDGRVFTYPCNKYAAIAAIHGCLTGDELYLHALRHQAVEPTEIYALENVPGMKKFPVVMEAMTELHGYYVQVFCPVSAQLFLPQRRDRLIVIGTRRPFNFRPPEGTRAVTLAEILEADPQIEIPKYVYRRLRGKYRDRPIISDPARGDIAPTCVAHYAKDVSTRLVVDKRFKHGVRPYTVREYARLQGVPDSYQFEGTEQEQYRQIGNGVAVPVGEWLGRELVRYFKHQRRAA